MKVKISKGKYDCFDESEIVCPFCGYREVDSEELNLNENREEIECSNCGRTFTASAEVIVSYTTTPIDVTDYRYWKVGEFHEDGNKTQEDEDWSNEQFYCEKEVRNENNKL